MRARIAELIRGHAFLWDGIDSREMPGKLRNARLAQCCLLAELDAWELASAPKRLLHSHQGPKVPDELPSNGLGDARYAHENPQEHRIRIFVPLPLRKAWWR